MKRSITYLFGACFAVCFMILGCNIVEFDNYSEPGSMLSGNVTYNGQPVGVKSPTVNANGNQTSGVMLELWQDGYELRERIPVFVNFDGSFSAMLFNGTYKLVQATGAPWAVSTDTITVNVNGNTQLDVAITPFFVVSNENFQRSGNTISATFNVSQVAPNANLDYVGLYLGRTLITDNVRFQASRTDSNPDLSGSITLTADIPASLLNQGYLFARVGVKHSGVSELMFTQVQRIDL